MPAKSIKTENHHWLPQFLIRNFTDNDGRVFRLDVHTDSVTKPPPKYAASRANFNELMVNGDPRSFEGEFGKVETSAAPAIAEILAKETLSALSPGQRSALAKFIAIQSFRTESYRRGLTAGNKRADLGDVIERMLASVDSLSAMISARHWALLVTCNDDPFYLGDSPVVFQSTEHPRKAMQVGFDVEGVEAFLPLSPTCALYMPCPDTCKEIIEGHQNALNIMLAALFRSKYQSCAANYYENPQHLADRVISRAGPLYRALSQGVALPANPDNVENLNYLQCVWASSGIFSNRPDFAFAKRVFRENPEYRDVPKVRIVEIW